MEITGHIYSSTAPTSLRLLYNQTFIAYAYEIYVNYAKEIAGFDYKNLALRGIVVRYITDSLALSAPHYGGVK
jgi:hypothetical protein